MTSPVSSTIVLMVDILLHLPNETEIELIRDYKAEFHKESERPLKSYDEFLRELRNA